MDSSRIVDQRPIHLVVFMHGFEGTYKDFDNAERALLLFCNNNNSQLRNERISILKPKGNSGFGGTYDGIERGTIRIWREVMERIKELKPFVNSISLIGHSLGGMYCRYLAHLLDDCLIFEEIEPRLFITLATPHLSVRRPQNTPLNIAFQKIAQKICKTSQELCMEDSPRPLLYRMTDEMYLSVLKKFKRRIVYSNVYNDFQVHYSTSSISTFNPYARSTTTVPNTTRVPGHESHTVVDTMVGLATRSRDYPDLTEWSLQSVSKRLRHIRQEDVDAFAKQDPYKQILKEMFIKLNEMTWERYDCVFSSVLAHEQIINKRQMFAGRDVIRHLIQEVFFKDFQNHHHHLERVSFSQNHQNQQEETDDDASVVRLGGLYVSQI